MINCNSPSAGAPSCRPSPAGLATPPQGPAGGSVPGPVHPSPVRALHWVNALAVLAMTASGLAILNADPILPFVMPTALTLGGDLTGALRWHLAMMWVLMANGAVALTLGLGTGRWRRRLWPVDTRLLMHEVIEALTARLRHDDCAQPNQIQRALYIAVIAVVITAVASGLSLWKPVQLAPLVAVFGDFDNARLVHFGCMVLIAGFTLLHAAMALLVPRSLWLMLAGGRA